MTDRIRDHRAKLKGEAAGAAVTSAGAAGAATAAVACCVPVVSPLLVAILGASGSVWVTGLKPYSPFLLFGSLVMLVYAFRQVYRSPGTCRLAVANSGRGASGPSLARLTTFLLWSSAVVWLAGVIAYIVWN